MVTAFFRVSLGGSLPGGEVWSINPVFGVVEGAQPAPSFSIMNAIAERIGEATIPVGVTAQMGTAVQMNKVRIEARNLPGELESVGEAAVNPVQSGVGTPNKPYQTSLVCSILTARPGASGRGRLYVPTLAVPIDATLRVPDANAQAFATGMYNWLTEISAAIDFINTDFNTTPAVYSGKLQQVNFMTSVSVGNVLDVQRRRRDKAVESRFSAP